MPGIGAERSTLVQPYRSDKRRYVNSAGLADEQEIVRAAMLVTVNGIATGMRNTG